MVKVHALGEIVLSSTDVARSEGSYLQGKTTNAQGFVADLCSLEFKREAQELRRQLWPERGRKDLVYLLPNTELVMDAFGFREFGTF